jgi:hypothetical protein
MGWNMFLIEADLRIEQFMGGSRTIARTEEWEGRVQPLQITRTRACLLPDRTVKWLQDLAQKIVVPLLQP